MELFLLSATGVMFGAISGSLLVMLMSLLGLSLLLDACPTLMACHVLPHLNFMRGP